MGLKSVDFNQAGCLITWTSCTSWAAFFEELFRDPNYEFVPAVFLARAFFFLTCPGCKQRFSSCFDDKKDSFDIQLFIWPILLLEIIFQSRINFGLPPSLHPSLPLSPKTCTEQDIRIIRPRAVKSILHEQQNMYRHLMFTTLAMLPSSVQQTSSFALLSCLIVVLQPLQ